MRRPGFVGESAGADSGLHSSLERAGFDRRGDRRRAELDPAGRRARDRRRLRRRDRRAGARGRRPGRLAALQPGARRRSADRLPVRTARGIRLLRPPRRRRAASAGRGCPLAGGGPRGPRRPGDRLALPRSRRSEERRLQADDLAPDRHRRLPLLPDAGDAPALHRHDERDAGRQPARDEALQRALLAGLRRDRVPAAGRARRAARRGGAGADARAGGRDVVPHSAALGLLHLQGHDRADGRPVPPARGEGRAMRALALVAADGPKVHLTSQTRIIAAILAVAFMVLILELIRRDRLQERYSVVWFVAGLGMLAGAAFPGLLALVADAMGVRDTNVALFSIVLLLLLGLALNFSVIMSRQAAQITRLAQERALERARAQAASGQNGSEAERERLES